MHYQYEVNELLTVLKSTDAKLHQVQVDRLVAELRVVVRDALREAL